MTVTEAQAWTVIGVLAATLISAIGLMARFGTNLVRESIGRVLDRIEALDQRVGERFKGLDYRFEAIDQRFEAMDKRFEAMDKRFETMDRRFDTMDKRISALDRDVQAIANRAFGGASASEA
jgi:flagellar capping protein FliD